MFRTLLLSVLLSALLNALTAADRAGPPPPVAPSKNQGRAGIYQVPTTIAAYNYYVCVPASYDGTQPAGLHLFFHGQNNQGAAKEWDRWQKPFLETYRLIGINMEYTDGDNGRDTAGKVKAAQEAIAQVTADYKVIQRGAIASFSGGASVHGLMADQFARTRSAQWPFCHSALYSSCFTRDPTPSVPMSWFIAVGTDEWNSYDLGRSAVGRTSELYLATAKGGTPDIRFFMSRKGHTITNEDVAASAKSFVISDLTFGEFLFAPDYPEKELRVIVEQANHQQPSSAAAALAKLLAKPTLAEALKTKAEGLQKQVSERLERIVTIIQMLPTEDPVLAAWYGPLLLAQLKGDAREKDLKAALATNAKNKETQTTLTAHAEFARQFAALFGAGGTNPGVVADKRPLLTTLTPHLPATSRAGISIADINAASR